MAGFSAFDPFQRAVAVVKTGQEKLRARADRQRGDPVKERIKVIRPSLPKDVSLLHLGAIFPPLARHRRRLAFALQEIGVEDFRAQRVNQKRAAPASLPENLYEWLSPASPVESALTDAGMNLSKPSERSMVEEIRSRLPSLSEAGLRVIQHEIAVALSVRADQQKN